MIAPVARPHRGPASPPSRWSPSGCEFDGAYDLPLPGSPVDEDSSFEVTAYFDDILNVVPRSPVMVDDVTVGEVTDVERVDWHAKVTLRVRDDVVLPDNAIADIRQVSLLGEKYVALEAPADGSGTGRLSDGDDIPLSATGRNPEVEEVLGALSFLLSGGGVAQLGTITHELNAGDDRPHRAAPAPARLAGRTWSARSTTRRTTSSTRWSRSTT